MAFLSFSETNFHTLTPSACVDFSHMLKIAKEWKHFQTLSQIVIILKMFEKFGCIEKWKAYIKIANSYQNFSKVSNFGSFISKSLYYISNVSKSVQHPKLLINLYSIVTLDVGLGLSF